MPNKTIVLIGQPNSGKSTLFNVLSDIKITTSNFPGTSVEYIKTPININGETFDLIDLPGLYSLNSGFEVEKQTLDFILNNQVDIIINVVDSSLLTRSLELTVELLEFGKPMVIALNMLDEAISHGITIDPKKLNQILGIPVVMTSGLYGKGVKELIDCTYNILKSNKPNKPNNFDFTHHIEKYIQEIIDRIKDTPIKINGSHRFYAIKCIENPDIIPKNVLSNVEDIIEKVKNECEIEHHRDCFESIAYERHHLSMKFAEEISTFKKSRKIPFIEKLDNKLLHPIIGHFFLFGFFGLYFVLIFIVGSFLSELFQIPLDYLSGLYEPLKTSQPLLWYLVDGGFSGFSGAFGIVLPYFLPLVFLTAFFEDTGYLARIAFLVDGLFHKIGLHGKSAIPFLLGFGCSIPAIYAARILESYRERVVAGMLIPFVPCTARIAVIFALTSAFTGPVWSIIIFIIVLIVIGINGKILSKILSKPMGLILEIPRLTTPSLRFTLRKTWMKIEEFLKEALPFLVLGSIALGLIEYFQIHIYLNSFLKPFLEYVLGLPNELGSTLLFGFFRKELILVMITQAFGVHSIAELPMLSNQIIVFIVFVTLYFPCFTTFVVIWKEFGWKVILGSSILSLIVATIVSVVIRIIISI